MRKYFPYFFPFRTQNRYQDSPESLFHITGVSLVIQAYIVVTLSFQLILNPRIVERNKAQFLPHKMGAEGGRESEAVGVKIHETDHSQKWHNLHWQ